MNMTSSSLNRQKQKPILEVSDLKTHYTLEQGLLRAVDGVSFALPPGKTLGVVGESGCGKSVTARSIMRLLPPNIGKIVSGSIMLDTGQEAPVDIAKLDPHGGQMRSIRGGRIGMIFQEPMTSLNPVYTVGYQIEEAIRAHLDLTKKEARERAVEMLGLVGIPEPSRRANQYQHEFSGGMRQRAMIAMAISANPAVLIADEPTTALDVTIEAQILQLIQHLQDQRNMAMVLITHDLNVIGEVADIVIVMYLGKLVETTTAADVFARPAHPYTQGLLRSLPEIGRRTALVAIAGQVPGPHERPHGCPFSPRCDQALAKCHQQMPPTFVLSEEISTACWLYETEREVVVDV